MDTQEVQVDTQEVRVDTQVVIQAEYHPLVRVQTLVSNGHLLKWGSNRTTIKIICILQINLIRQ